MPSVSSDTARAVYRLFESTSQAYNDWDSEWRDLANYILPRRYSSLDTKKRNERAAHIRPRYLLDSTSTLAIRILAGGLMGGITSPARPWLKIGISGIPSDELDRDAKIWADTSTLRMLRALAQSNFYDAMGILYLDYPTFGTAGMLIYEDFEEIFRFYNTPVGEFRLGQDGRNRVNTVARAFMMRAYQIKDRWGLENSPRPVRNSIRNHNYQNEFRVHHLITPNDGSFGVPASFPFVEFYWSDADEKTEFLEVSGYRSFPGVFPRWQTLGNDIYGTGPGADALPDIKQLQHETKKKAQGLDRMVDPPMLADASLRHQPTAFFPRGITYVNNLAANGGARAIDSHRMPIAELSADIREVQTRIKETFFNDLFMMISQLDTVRSATEIDARSEEKLVRLGNVLERFENEALNPIIQRCFGIMERAGLIPQRPPSIEGREIAIQYESILSDAQRAIGTASTERLFALLGNLAAVYPEVRHIPDVDELLRDYAERIGVPAKGLRDRRDTAERLQAETEAQQTMQGAELSDTLTRATKQLSETDVGGGANAVQALLGGG